MLAQRGWFTIHGDLHRPLNHMSQLTGKAPLLLPIPIPLPVARALRQYLADLGIAEFLLFPDLDGLGRDLINKYSIQM